MVGQFVGRVTIKKQLATQQTSPEGCLLLLSFLARHLNNITRKIKNFKNKVRLFFFFYFVVATIVHPDAK